MYDANLVAQYAKAVVDGDTRLQEFYRTTLFRPAFLPVIERWQQAIQEGETPPRLLEDREYLDSQLADYQATQASAEAKDVEAKEAAERRRLRAHHAAAGVGAVLRRSDDVVQAADGGAARSALLLTYRGSADRQPVADRDVAGDLSSDRSLARTATIARRTSTGGTRTDGEAAGSEVVRQDRPRPRPSPPGQTAGGRLSRRRRRSKHVTRRGPYLRHVVAHGSSAIGERTGRPIPGTGVGVRERHAHRVEAGASGVDPPVQLVVVAERLLPTELDERRRRGTASWRSHQPSVAIPCRSRAATEVLDRRLLGVPAGCARLSARYHASSWQTGPSPG